MLEDTFVLSGAEVADLTMSSAAQRANDSSALITVLLPSPSTIHWPPSPADNPTLFTSKKFCCTPMVLSVSSNV
jgi:hypothetical protein